MTKSRLLFILACESQQPPHIRCEIGGVGEGWQRWGGGCNGVKTFLPHITALRFLTRRAPSLRTLARLSHPLTLFPSVGSCAAYVRCIYMYKTGFAQTVMRYCSPLCHWRGFVTLAADGCPNVTTVSDFKGPQLYSFSNFHPGLQWSRFPQSVIQKNSIDVQKTTCLALCLVDNLLQNACF